MIGIDTNILVTAYLEDDKYQASEAQEFLSKASSNNKLFISSYALLEFVWVLKVKNFSREQIHQSAITLVTSENIVIGQRMVVLNALEKYTKGKADFGDYMILAEGEINKSYQVKTFDKEFSKGLQTSSV